MKTLHNWEQRCQGASFQIVFSPPESEKRSLQASAIAQSQLGCGVIIHPGRNESAPAEIGRILQEAGGDLHKTVMSHLDSKSNLHNKYR